ncbi:MAG: hypothetical protein L3J20_01875 [Flavobacteriaceae bacterium]|nr:hypothetical protein [Flavobacteriaceae bacterium]
MNEKKNDREMLLKETLTLIDKYGVTAYEIEQNTDLTAVGVQKIINGETLKPQKRTLDSITNYINKKYLGIGNDSNIINYLEIDGIKISISVIENYVVNNEEVFMKKKGFKNMIELRVAKKLLELVNNPEKIKEFLKN